MWEESCCERPRTLPATEAEHLEQALWRSRAAGVFTTPSTPEVGCRIHEAAEGDLCRTEEGEWPGRSLRSCGGMTLAVQRGGLLPLAPVRLGQHLGSAAMSRAVQIYRSKKGASGDLRLRLWTSLGLARQTTMMKRESSRTGSTAEMPVHAALLKAKSGNVTSASTCTTVCTSIRCVWTPRSTSMWEQSKRYRRRS